MPSVPKIDNMNINVIENDKKSPWLTTIDNVWNPFTNFDEWLAFDISNQHYSSQTLAKIALVSDSLSDEENRQELERAIDCIVAIDPSREFVKVYSDTFDMDMKKAMTSYQEWYSKIAASIGNS